LDATRNKYTVHYAGKFLVELEKPAELLPTYYAGSLTGWAGNFYPFFEPESYWLHHNWAGFAPSYWMPKRYQTGDSRFLGTSKTTTVSGAGCHYISFGMIVEHIFGINSPEYQHWADMKWMCDHGAFSGDLLIPAVAARLLNMKYFPTMAATKENMEWAYAHGWEVYVSLKGHFVAATGGVRITSGGEYIWDYINDPNKNRSENPNVQPRFNTDPAYKNRILGVRVLAPLFSSDSEPYPRGGAIPYEVTKNGWWLNKKPTLASSASSSEVDIRGFDINDLADESELYGFSSLVAMTSPGVFISRVTTPTGDVAEGDPYLNPDQHSISRQSACLTDPYPDDVPADSWYSEYGEDDAVPGIRTFYLTGNPGANYSVHFTKIDCSNNMTTEIKTGLLNESGMATVILDYQPGNLEKGPRELTSPGEVKDWEIGEPIYFQSLGCTLSDESGFYAQESPYGSCGARINWTGEAPVNGWVGVTGTIVAKEPEVIIEATMVDSRAWLDLQFRPRPLMLTENIGAKSLLPYCELVKVVGKVEAAADGKTTITCGQLRLQLESSGSLSDLAGHTVELQGILRADQRLIISPDVLPVVHN